MQRSPLNIENTSLCDNEKVKLYLYKTKNMDSNVYENDHPTLIEQLSKRINEIRLKAGSGKTETKKSEW